jgi:hypothetical protein
MDAIRRLNNNERQFCTQWTMDEQQGFVICKQAEEDSEQESGREKLAMNQR